MFVEVEELMIVIFLDYGIYVCEYVICNLF